MNPNFDKDNLFLVESIDSYRPDVKEQKAAKQKEDNAREEAAKVLASLQTPIVIPKGISFLPKKTSTSAVPSKVPVPVKAKADKPKEKKEVKQFDQFGEEFKSTTPSNKEITNPIGILATPGSLNAQDFLDLVVDFDYGNDSADSSGIITPGFEQACNKLASVLNFKDANVKGMRNHERVRACVDAYIGLPINAPLGFYLSYALDLARSEVNPDGGWVPALTQSILNETIVKRRDYVSKLDAEQRRLNNALGRYCAAILGDESDFRLYLKAGNKLGCAEVLLLAMRYGLMLEEEVEFNFNEDVFFNLAQLAGFTIQQCGLIVKTGIDSFYNGFGNEAKDRFKKDLMILGPMPVQEKKNNDLSASMAELLKSKGLPLPSALRS